MSVFNYIIAALIYYPISLVPSMAQAVDGQAGLVRERAGEMIRLNEQVIQSIGTGMPNAIITYTARIDPSATGASAFVSGVTLESLPLQPEVMVNGKKGE